MPKSRRTSEVSRPRASSAASPPRIPLRTSSSPDYGRITGLPGRHAGYGIRLDGGNRLFGRRQLTPFYDSLLEKLTAWDADAPTSRQSPRMDRALREFRIRGVATNLPFLEKRSCNHPRVPAAARRSPRASSTRRPELVPLRRAAATGRRACCSFVGEVHQSTATRTMAGKVRRQGLRAPRCMPVLPKLPAEDAAPWQRARSVSRNWVPRAFARLDEATRRRLLLTDTTFRDAHQSLLATRMRSHRHDRQGRAPLRSACCRSCSQPRDAGAAPHSMLRHAIPATRIPGSG